MSFVTFWKSVKSKVSSLFVAILGKDAAQKLGEAAVAALNTWVGVIVKDAVTAASSLMVVGTGGKLVLASGSQQRDAAVKQITSDSKIQAAGLSASLINLMIELAVQTVVKKTIVAV